MFARSRVSEIWSESIRGDRKSSHCDRKWHDFESARGRNFSKNLCAGVLFILDVLVQARETRANLRNAPNPGPEPVLESLEYSNQSFFYDRTKCNSFCRRSSRRRSKIQPSIDRSKFEAIPLRKMSICQLSINIFNVRMLIVVMTACYLYRWFETGCELIDKIDSKFNIILPSYPFTFFLFFFFSVGSWTNLDTRCHWSRLVSRVGSALQASSI